MYCPNCGERNSDELAKVNSNAVVERGDYDEVNYRYAQEQDVSVLECTACQQEFIVL